MSRSACVMQALVRCFVTHAWWKHIYKSASFNCRPEPFDNVTFRTHCIICCFKIILHFALTCYFELLPCDVLCWFLQVVLSLISSAAMHYFLPAWLVKILVVFMITVCMVLHLWEERERAAWTAHWNHMSYVRPEYELRMSITRTARDRNELPASAKISTECKLSW